MDNIKDIIAYQLRGIIGNIIAFSIYEEGFSEERAFNEDGQLIGGLEFAISQGHITKKDIVDIFAQELYEELGRKN